MRLPHLFLIIAVSVMLTLVGGEIARAQDAAPSIEEAQLPPKPQSPEEALVEAVRDGDLPRVEKLLVRPVAPETLSFLAHELAARPYTFYCGLDSNLPRVPWTRVRFLPVFQRLLRAITAVDGDKGDSGNSLLTAAASLGDLESVRCLVERGADVKYQESIQTVTVGYPEPTKIGGTSPLLEAVRSGIRNSDPDPGPLVAYLLREGADVNAVDAGGSTALMAASGIGNIGVVHALLAAGADANIRMENGQSCLDRARRNKHKKIAALLATVTDMNLTEASAVNDAGAVRRLLDGGASVNFADTESGETALMAAAQAGATDAAKVLLERGAAVHRTDRRGKNALHLAVEQGNVATVELLLDHKADPDASLVGKDDKGNTVPDEWRESEFPLILAIRGGYIPVVETLLRRGAGIDTPARKNTIASAFAMAAGRDGTGDTPPLKRADTIRLLDLLIGAGLSLRDDPIAVCAAQSA
ncbi:MAG: ankyrin repeat domain-containing protein, partial [Akkermansiaceae bacterium]|nr:ankyrin repeat domain-containing protein [Armatimonadota bacterium]